MSETNITVNKNNLMKICSISLTVIFFILSFLTAFNNIAVFVLGILILGIVILLSYKSFKGFNFYSLGIILIPILSYGIIMSLSIFAKEYYSISTRIFSVINILLFLLAGYFSRLVDGFDFKWIFKGIFISLSIICLINLIFTTVYYGPFYGLLIPHHFSYYNGVASRVTVSGTAYALCGFNVKQVPIEYYLIYPFLLMTSIFFYLLGDRKNKVEIISSSIFVFISLISLVFVISKVSLILIAIFMFFVATISLVLIFKKIYNKAFKYGLIIVASLVGIFFIIFFINSQFSFVGFRNFISSNRLLNYVFNANRYSEVAKLILNNAFSSSKAIGFYVYFDNDYRSLVYPSNNLLINQFMYGGVFAFFFFIIISILFIYLLFQLRKIKIEDKTYKYFPMLFVISYLFISMISDQNSIDLYDPNLILASYLSPFFLISIFIFAHYHSLSSKEAEADEK